ncbi:small serum protein 5-like, partial [Python bivittatus]|uniref:Small serum protein 5-like n=1 Tax=Python bivittatus TaxID=176946 RepID=A0A9F2RFL5_PYTBI
MRVFFSLIIFSFILATCQGACMLDPFKVKFEDGKVVKPNTCVDPFDRTRHLLGSTWNTAHCLRCECHRDGMSCCTRPAGIEGRAGCKGV